MITLPFKIKMVTLAIQTLVAALSFATAPADHIPIPDWTYSDTAVWKNIYPECGWSQQSPIDIPSDTIPACLEPLRFENLYWPQNNLELQNIYRAARLSFDVASSYPLLVSGGPLPKGVWYYATEIDFKVGVDDRTGADHTLQGVDYPMEIQIGFSTDPIVTLENGTNVVLSFFITISADDNESWEPIIQALSQIKQGGSHTTVSFASIASLLPPYYTWETKYYSYLGSWVAPPCKTKVTRVVYTTFIGLSERQIHAFRLLQDENGRPITNNNRRPLRSLEYRPVLSTLPTVY